MKRGHRMEVKWIKVCTDIFDDEKIQIIESMPEADTILVIWFKLLAQAGKINDNGFVYFRSDIPYTDDMLATIFRKPLGTIRLALQTFVKFGMIKIFDSKGILIANWEKHQNIDGLEKIREDNRKRKQKQRDKQKLLLCHVTSHETITPCHATEEELEIEIDIDNNNIIMSTSEEVDEPKEETKVIDQTEEFKNLYNLTVKKLSKVQKLSEKRKKQIRLRLKEEPDFFVWKKAFLLADNSKFVTNGEGSWCNFDWFIQNDTNFLKAYEGKYNTEAEKRSIEKILLNGDDADNVTSTAEDFFHRISRNESEEE